MCISFKISSGMLHLFVYGTTDKVTLPPSDIKKLKEAPSCENQSRASYWVPKSKQHPNARVDEHEIHIKC